MGVCRVDEGKWDIGFSGELQAAEAPFAFGLLGPFVERTSAAAAVEWNLEVGVALAFSGIDFAADGPAGFDRKADLRGDLRRSLRGVDGLVGDGSFQAAALEPKQCGQGED